MSKTETLRQSAAALNESRNELLAVQIETLRQAKHESAEELAATLEPLAQAMAALAEETKQTLAEIDRKSTEQAERFKQQTSQAAQDWREASKEAQIAMNGVYRASRQISMANYGLAIGTALITALLVSAFWLWLFPPKVETLLDPQAVAEYLKPSVIEALKPSKGR